VAETVEVALAVEAMFWLTLSKILILCVPFKKIAALLGEHMFETSHVKDIPYAVAQVQQGIDRASRRLLWRAKCFDKAIAAKIMLRRRRIASTLYLGVKKGDEKSLMAHAWLRCGDVILTGGKEKDGFVVVSYFGERTI
jgi:hypothetical protein